MGGVSVFESAMKMKDESLDMGRRQKWGGASFGYELKRVRVFEFQRISMFVNMCFKMGGKCFHLDALCLSCKSHRVAS